MTFCFPLFNPRFLHFLIKIINNCILITITVPVTFLTLIWTDIIWLPRSINFKHIHQLGSALAKATFFKIKRPGFYPYILLNKTLWFFAISHESELRTMTTNGIQEYTVLKI